MWHCPAHVLHWKMYIAIKKKPCLSPAVLSLVTLVTPPRSILAQQAAQPQICLITPSFSPTEKVLIIRTKIASPRSATHTIDTVPNAVLAAEEIELARKRRNGGMEKISQGRRFYANKRPRH